MRFDDDLDREIRDHLELDAEERRARGATDDDARFAARRQFGNVGLVKEAVRATRRFARLDGLRQDFRYALRGLRRSPAFTLTAVLSLTLGIGANTAVFSLINALLLRTLPVTDPGRLMQISIDDKGKPRQTFSYVAVTALAKQVTGFTGLCGFALGESFAIGEPGSDRHATGTWMTGDCHRVLGVGFTLGRGFTPDDDRRDATGLVAVISHDYWVRDLARTPDVIGRQITLDGKPVTIIGVTSPGFTGPNVGRTADITMPVASMLRLRPDGPPIFRPGMNWLRLFARLQPDVSREQAEAGLAVAWPRLIEEIIEPSSRAGYLAARLALTPGGTGWSDLRTQFTRPLVVLMGIVGLVLLIACANLASLLLARAAARRREFAVRLAMGAGRARLMRQVFTESMLLALIGGGAAVIFAQISSGALISLLSSGSRRIALDVAPDATVLLFALGMVLVTSLLCGLAPAFRATAIDESSALHQTAQSRGARRGRAASALVVAQAALSLVLVAGATLFTRTFDNLLRVDLGFRADGVTLAFVDIPRAARDSAQQASLAQAILDELRSLPGVRAASLSGSSPLGGGWTLGITLEDNPGAGKGEADIITASPSYFEVFGTALRAGRDFSRTDGAGAPRVVIVNDAFVRERYGPANPLGRRIRIGGRGDESYEIIGVVQSVRSEGARKGTRPAVYLSFFQSPNPQLSGGGTLALYTDRAVVTADAIRDRVRAHAASAGVRVGTFKDRVDGLLVNERLLAVLASFFGVLALSLAAIGLYGLLAFGVSRRTTEIGVRAALGATNANVMWLVMSEALRLVGVGVAIGLPAIWATTRVVSGMLFGLTPTDPATIGMAVALILATALIAAYLPARRATRINPITALKYE